MQEHQLVCSYRGVLEYKNAGQFMTQKINSRKRTTDAAKRRGTPSLSPLFLLLKSIIDVTALVRNSTVHEQFSNFITTDRKIYWLL